MDKASFEKRKKVIYDLICDSFYIPMKFKELAMLLQVPKEQRDELRQVLEALEMEGKVYFIPVQRKHQIRIPYKVFSFDRCGT